MFMGLIVPSACLYMNLDLLSLCSTGEIKKKKCKVSNIYIFLKCYSSVPKQTHTYGLSVGSHHGITCIWKKIVSKCHFCAIFAEIIQWKGSNRKEIFRLKKLDQNLEHIVFLQGVQPFIRCLLLAMGLLYIKLIEQLMLKSCDHMFSNFLEMATFSPVILFSFLTIICMALPEHHLRTFLFLICSLLVVFSPHLALYFEIYFSKKELFYKTSGTF